MRAHLYRQYGPSSVLKLEDCPKPVPAANELLIKVHAVSINPYDWHLLRGEPYLLRLMTGLRQPKDPRLGADLAGEVEAVGRSVTHFKPGDAIFGVGKGAFAEFACAQESQIALKPTNVSFEQAAAVPIAGLTALQALRKAGLQQSNLATTSQPKILINGAAGGVGTFSVQIAKAFLANITAVCSTRNVQMVRALGADRVIDYTREDFTTGNQLFEIILDNVGNRPLLACRRLLVPKGFYIGAGGSAGRWMVGTFARAIISLTLSAFGGRKFLGIFAKPTTDDLTILHNLMQSGKVTPVIDRRYAFAELPQAIAYLEEGHARGKVIINVGTQT
jgi:NADPH:quinone reductase-like Zn-dependent oxidoreductase